MRILSIACFLALSLSACKENTPDPNPDQWKQANSRVLIGNEGNFGWGEGTLSVYDSKEHNVSQDVYKTVNTEALGNVLHAISKHDNRYYFVVNNSQKIVVTDSQFNKLGEIEGFVSPRQLTIISDNKAMISDLYANKLWEVDLQSLTITDEIPVSGWVEHSLKLGNLLYYGSMENDQLYVLDLTSNSITDSLTVNYAIQSLQTDGSNLWVLSQGNQQQGAELSEIELNSLTKVDSVELTGLPSHLNYHQSSNTLYFMNEDVYKITLDGGLQNNLFIELEAEVPYAFALDQDSEEFYVSDAHDFVKQSTVYRYNRQGEEIDRFKCGIISSSFLFD